MTHLTHCFGWRNSTIPVQRGPGNNGNEGLSLHITLTRQKIRHLMARCLSDQCIWNNFLQRSWDVAGKNRSMLLPTVSVKMWTPFVYVIYHGGITYIHLHGGITYIHLHTHTHTISNFLSFSFNIYIYIYIYHSLSLSIYIYIYIYIYSTAVLIEI